MDDTPTESLHGVRFATLRQQAHQDAANAEKRTIGKAGLEWTPVDGHYPNDDLPF